MFFIILNFMTLMNLGFKQNAGYKVWLDIDNMEGSTLEAMAGAVENASVVLVCVTHSYKISPNCRTGILETVASTVNISWHSP